MVVAHAHVEPGAQRGVGLVGGDDLVLERRLVEVARRHALERPRRAPRCRTARRPRARNAVGIEVAHRDEVRAGGAEQLAVAGLRVFERGGAHPRRCARRRSACSSGGPGSYSCRWRARRTPASEEGSLRCDSAPLSAARFISSNSAGGNDGSRSTSATRRSAGIRFSPRTSMLAPSPPTETEAFSFSKASFSSARLRLRVPRISMRAGEAARGLAVGQALLVAPVQREASPPRGRRASASAAARALMPLRQLASCTTRFSMFCGEGSNASPRRTLSPPL